MRRRRRKVEPIVVKPSRPDPFAEYEAREIQRMRERCLRRYDGLPQPIRDALRECLFDVHILIHGNLNVEKVVGRIQAIKSISDAQRFNHDFC